jgi:uncharacterized protein HemY
LTDDESGQLPEQIHSTPAGGIIATLAMGLGNALYAHGDKSGAGAVFRQVVERHHLAAAYNNLARLLLERGNTSEARLRAERGLTSAGPMRETLIETLQAIDTTAPSLK